MNNKIELGNNPNTNKKLSWTILDKNYNNTNSVLVLCDEIIEQRKFDKLNNDYNTSELREYINNDLVYKVFNKEELKLLNSESDKMFILSIEEYQKYKINISNINSHWWLRTPSIHSSRSVSYVLKSSNTYYFNVHSNDIGIRPILLINI